MEFPRLKGALRLLILFSAEGFLALLWTAFTPSESGNAVFLWLSLQRILLSVCMLALWVLIAGFSLSLWRSHRLDRILEGLDEWCLVQKRLGSLLPALFVVPLLISAATAKVLLTPLEFSAYQSWAPDTFPLLHALLTATLPLISWLLLSMLESGLYLTLRYGRAAADPELWAWERIGPSLILMLIAVVTLLHWIILAFQLRVLVNIPAWYWKIEPIPFSWRDLWFGLGVLVLLALICWIISLRRSALAALLLIFFLGWFLQIGVGILAGGGFTSLAERYFSTYHKAYVAQASQNRETILNALQHYEPLFGARAFTSTKPPGLMAFYIGVEQLANGYPSAYSDQVRYERLSQLIEFAFPLLAASMVIILYAFTRHFLPAASGPISVTAPLLYVLCPNVVLFSFFPDQALYPLVFLLGVWFAVSALRRQSLAWAFSLGVVLYLAVFFAFSMLPLYAFAGLYLLLNHWSPRSEGRWTRPLVQALAIGAGTILLYILLRLFLGYDFFPRFEKTMAINHNFDFYLRVGLPPPAGSETLSTRLIQIINAAWVNNLDFAAAIGFPIYILFVVQALRLMRRLRAGAAGAGDKILASLLLSFIILNLAGTAQGEVPRLWLFWLPMMCMLAALEIETYAARRTLLFFGLGLAQFVTIFLTYHFQDLRM